MNAVELYLSSGELLMMFPAGASEPTTTATYCSPLNEKVTGGALMPEPTLKL